MESQQPSVQPQPPALPLRSAGVLTRSKSAEQKEAQDQAEPNAGTIVRVRQILNYLAHYPNIPLIYSAFPQALHLHAFSDASYAADSDRKSITGVVAKLSGGATSCPKRLATRSSSRAMPSSSSEG